MQKLLSWTNTTISKNGLLRGWIEEKKIEWVSHMSSPLKSLLHKGSSILIVTDSEFEWFENYILSTINNSVQKRPFLPFYSLNSFCTKVNCPIVDKDITLIQDMLSISFPHGYTIWYIGKLEDSRANLVKISKNRPIIWSLDKERESFLIPKENQDIRLLQLFKLLNLTISGVVFDEINLDIEA
jgi:hypothetical protein